MTTGAGGPIDGPFGSGASPEMARELDGRRLVQRAGEILNSFGVRQTVDVTAIADSTAPDQPQIYQDICVDVTTAGAQIEVAGKAYTARLARFAGTDIQRFGADYYLALDKDPDDPLQVDILTLVRLEVGDRPEVDEDPGLYTIRGFNDPLDLAIVKGLVDKIESDEKAAVARQQAEREAALAVAQAEADNRITQQNRQEREAQEAKDRKRQEWKELATRIGINGGVVLAGGAVVTGVVFGVGKAIEAATPDCDDKCTIKKFDAKTPDLATGVVIGIGGSAHPLHSRRAVQDDRLRRDKVPELNAKDDPADSGPDAGGSAPDKEGDVKGIRKIVLTTSNENQGKEGYCETVDVNFTSPTDAIRVVTPETDRAQQLTVKVGEATITLCWRGKERDSADDPYVLVQQVKATKDNGPTSIPRQRLGTGSGRIPDSRDQSVTVGTGGIRG